MIATLTAALAERTARTIRDAAAPATVAATQIMLPFEIYGPESI